MKYQKLEQLVVEWGDDRGILDNATPLAQINKTIEEVNELHEAITAQSKGFREYVNSKGKICKVEDEIIDGIGDSVVTLILQAELQGLSLEDCLEVAYKVISKRQGKMIDGVFVKNK